MDTMSQLLATTLATMTPTETATLLRQFNEWRRGDEDIPQPDPREIGEAIDAAIEMLESAERDQLAAEIEALRAEVDAPRLNAASVQPELVAVALAACDAVDDLIEKWYATRESGCLPNQVVRARGASKLLRAIALEGTK